MATEEEKLFVRTAISRKFCTKEQVTEALRLRKERRTRGGDLPPVADFLVQEKCLTSHQVEIVRQLLTGGDPNGAGASSSPASADSQGIDRLGTMINGYEIIKKIDKGAMGTVYKARQISMDRIVAFKILSKKLSRNKEFVERFEREARATAKLSHPNIILGIDVGESEGRRYFVMEYVDGRTVQDLLKRGGPLDEKRALTIVQQIARALDHAHKHHLVHRDVKPENIMVTRDQQAKLCDLGLAKVLGSDENKTEAGKSLGTPNYISPEQARGDLDVDIRSDLYSLGASLFHMVIGQVPFTGSPAVVMTKHIYEQPPDPNELRPDLSADIGILIAKMMAKDPKDRYQAPAELLADLEKVLEGKPLAVKTEAPAQTAEDEGGTKGRRLTRSKRVRRVRSRRGRRSR